MKFSNSIVNINSNPNSTKIELLHQ